jgi:hypothetical protein
MIYIDICNLIFEALSDTLQYNKSNLASPHTKRAQRVEQAHHWGKHTIK